MQTATRIASYDEIIADPLFKRGYAEVFDGIECASDIRWLDAELEAYERGRQFGQVVKASGEGRIALTRGYLAHPRASFLLMMAMISKDVL